MDVRRRFDGKESAPGPTWKGYEPRKERKVLGSSRVLQHFKSDSGSVNDGYDVSEPPRPSSTTTSTSSSSFSSAGSPGGSPPRLNEQQQSALDYVTSPSSPNVFLSGSAGTGKSFLLRSIIKALRRAHGEDSVAVTAPTGIAATNLDGQTIHSFSGCGLGTGPVGKLAGQVKKNKKASARWNSCRTLVIDEVSMLDPEFFGKLDHVAKEVRRNRRKAFGGVQLILCGDFFQLPPVRNNTFCFESDTWMKCKLRCINLTEVIRQVGDSNFVKILNDCRRGGEQCDERSVVALVFRSSSLLI